MSTAAELLKALLGAAAESTFLSFPSATTAAGAGASICLLLVHSPTSHPSAHAQIMSEWDPLTSGTRPLSDSIITIRLIKSFTYRTSKNLVLPHVDLETTTVGRLKELIKEEIAQKPALKPYRTATLDTLKIYTKAHGSKTTNLIINLDHDEDWTLVDEQQTLAAAGLENEAEVSFFKQADYLAFKENPETRWE